MNQQDDGCFATLYSEMPGEPFTEPRPRSKRCGARMIRQRPPRAVGDRAAAEEEIALIYDRERHEVSGSGREHRARPRNRSRIALKDIDSVQPRHCILEQMLSILWWAQSTPRSRDEVARSEAT
jgi:hypothetical protein